MPYFREKLILAKRFPCQWIIGLSCFGTLFLFLSLRIYCFGGADRVVTPRPLTLPIQPVVAGVLDVIDVQRENCPPFRNIKGQEESQLSVAWSKLFNFDKIHTVTEIIMHFEQHWLLSLPLFYKYKSKYELFHRPKVEDFQFGLSPLVYNGTHMCIRITETLRGSPTKGGSNFQLTIRGPSSIDTARSWDNFNGTYNICAQYYELHQNVFLTLHFTMYEAFIHQVGTKTDKSRNLMSSNIMLSPRDRTTIVSNVPFQLSVNESADSLLNKVEEKHALSKLPRDVHQLSLMNGVTAHLKERYVQSHEVCHAVSESHWVVYKSQWRLKYRGHIVGRPHPARLRDCLNEYDNVDIVGDSHLRLIYYYLLTFITGPYKDWEVKEHLDLKCGHFRFWWRPRGKDFLEYLQELKSSLIDEPLFGFTNRQSKKRGRLIVMGIGHHDIDIQKWDSILNGAGLYFSNMRKVLRLLSDIVELSRINDIKLLWLAHPGMQWKYTVVASGRNNYLLAAMNQWLLPQIIQLGIPVFNFFDMTFVLNDQDACSGHFLCVFPSKHVPEGHAGQAMADLLFTQICPDTKQNHLI